MPQNTRLSIHCTHSYRDRLGLHSLSVFFQVAKSSRISMNDELSAEILESLGFNPCSTHCRF